MVSLVTTVLHLPELLHSGPVNPDEAFVATEARVLVGGGRLYVDVVDRKPPLLPLVYEAIGRVGGTGSLFPVHFASVVCASIAALMVGDIARLRWGHGAAWAASLLCAGALAGLPLVDSQAAGFEVFALVPVVGAVWLAQRGRPLLAGISVGLAALTLQVGLAAAVPVSILVWRSGRARSAALAALGTIATGGLGVVAFGGGRVVFWVLAASKNYVDPNGSGPLIVHTALDMGRLFIVGSGVVLLLAFTHLRAWRADADLWTWLLAATAAAAASLQFLPHYTLLLDPPLALLAAGALAGRSGGALRTWTIASLGVAVVLAVQAGTSHPAILDRDRHVAAAVDAHSTPSQSVVIWGQEPELYWNANRAPATRFLTAGFLTGYSPSRSAASIGIRRAVPGSWTALVQDLQQSPPALIVDVTPNNAIGARRYPPLEAILSADYRPIQRVDGSVLYARR